MTRGRWGVAVAFLVAAASVQPAASAGVGSAAVAKAPSLDSGDRLKVVVFDEAALSGEYEIDPEGMLPMPLLGPVQVRGRTTREIQLLLAALLREGGFVTSPRVTVSVAAYRPFYVLGEVNQPGEYPYRVGMTAANAVATAQGFSYRANRRRVYIRRAGSHEEVSATLTADLALMPGDTLRIGERFF